MATIQASSFTKNGSLPSVCSVQQSDRVGVDIVVSFGTGETGTMDCFAYVKFPDGSDHSIRMTQTVTSAITVDFTSDLPTPLQIGTYRIGQVQVWNRESGQLLAQIYP